MNRDLIEKYSFKHYLSLERWVSFYCQLDTVIKLKPSSVLEVGKGGGVFGEYLLRHTDILYRSLDLDPQLQPDLVGSITQIPSPDSSFDVTVAFEVLEHLPFSSFEIALGELCRVAKHFVVVSLPDSRPHFRWFCKMPFFPKIEIAYKFPFPKKHIVDGEHYWEIGKRGYGNQKITKIMERYCKSVRQFIPFHNQYHHFYILEK